MSESDKRQHREAIYSGRSPLEVSWYRKESALPLIDRCGLEQDAAIIEVDGLTSCSGLDIDNTMLKNSLQNNTDP
jgi:hypothetical protein